MLTGEFSKFLVNVTKKHILRTFVLINLIFIAIFSVIYKLISKNGSFNTNNDKNELDWLDAIYFSLMTHSTVGYGDISPKNRTSKICVMIQVILVIILTSNFALKLKSI